MSGYFAYSCPRCTTRSLKWFPPRRWTMKKSLLITGALLALAASTAMAGGMNMSWTDCGAAGQQNRNFACNVNTGNNVLCVSYDPLASVPDFVGNEMTVDVISTGVLPAWWQMFNAGSCRGTALPTLNTTFAAATCGDNFGGAGFGAIGSYVLGPNTGSLLCGWAVADGVPIDAGTEYYAVNIVVSNTKTVGTGLCAGCQTGACIVLNRVSLAYGPAATLVQDILTPLNRNWVTWQNGNGQPCPPPIVPTNQRTWGQVKALYR